MYKQVRIKDKIPMREFGFRGEVIFGKGKYQKEYTDPFGNKTYRNEFEEVLYRGKNIVTIGGYQFAFNKLFNIAPDTNSTLVVDDLNSEAPLMRIGVPRASYKSNKYNTEIYMPSGSSVSEDENYPPIGGVKISALNYICGFMMGDGGSREDNITAISPDYKRRTLFRAVPFRMSNDNPRGKEGIEAGRYYGRQTIYVGATQTEVTSYYVKRFDSQPRIVHVWSSDDVLNEENLTVDSSCFQSTSSNSIDSYVELDLSISNMDGRGFFTSTSATPRVNEFALVTGWYNPTYPLNLGGPDFESLRVFTHYTRPSISLADGDAVDIIYRLYSR